MANTGTGDPTIVNGKKPYRYDVFISHSPNDKSWVEDWLLPRLTQEGLSVGVGSTAFVIGAPKLVNVEQAFQSSCRVIIVLTPDWLASELSDFEATLLRFSDPAARRRKLLPLLLKPCELPEAITALKLEPSDFTVEKNWERETRRLRRDIEDAIPVPFPPGQGGAGKLQLWARWLRRYRHETLRGGLIVLAVGLISISLFQIPPFEPRLGWQALGSKVKGAERLARVGDVLLVSTSTDFVGCDQANTGDTGLWRSDDGGRQWNYVVMPELKDYSEQGCKLAAISAFASAAALPGQVYASTSDAGLLRGDNAGESWERLGEATLSDKHLRTVAVEPRKPYTVWTAAEGAGLYRWLADKNQWSRVDGMPTCQPGGLGKASLPADMSVGAILATADAVYIGTDEGLNPPGKTSGIYRSQDGGNCWERLDDAQERYSYLAIAEIPNATGQLVVLALDQEAVPGRPNHQLWVLEGHHRRTPGLWESGHAVNRLYVDAGPPPTWYVISDLGEIYRGPVATRGGEPLPMVTRCLLPPTCLTDLAPDLKPGPPLILAIDRVYRLAPVAWWQRLWP